MTATAAAATATATTTTTVRRPSPLLGLAIGDALGAPFETCTPDDPRLLAWDGKSFSPTPPHAPWHEGLKPGQWTDDTKMARCIAESLVEKGSYDAYDVLQRYLAWYKSGDHRGIGGTTKKALEAHHWATLEKPLDEHAKAGTQFLGVEFPGSCGNGTAMRIGPLGLFYRKNWPVLLAMAGKDAEITHFAQEAVAASQAVALAVAMASDGAAPNTMIDVIVEALPQRSETRLRLCSVARHGGDPDAMGCGDGFSAPMAVMRAFDVFTYSDDVDDSYLKIVAKAIRAGGDTDTVGAIAGTIAGAYYGIGGEHGIPQHLVDQVEDGLALIHLDIQLAKGPR